MRHSRFMAFAAFLLLPVTASAQTATTTTTTGAADLGVRGSTSVGDAARYERYRDLGDGLFLDAFRLDRRQNDWLFSLTSDHLGRKDQRVLGRAVRQGTFKGWFMWDQVPMLLSRNTQTFFQGDVRNNTGILTIDDAIQQAGQTSANNLRPLFVPPNTQTFETSTRRHVAEAGFQYLPTQALNIRALFRNTDRAGAIPYGGSFGHSQLVETLAPTSHQLRDVDASAEWSEGRYLFRAGYTGSWFHNDYTTLTFDNPWRLTDTLSTSSRGRLSLSPTNSYIGVNGTASVRLPHRSRATLYLSSGVLKDAGDPLMPYSANTVVTGQNPLPRQTVGGEAGTLASTFSFTSRPHRNLDFALRYRTYEYDNKTPIFETSQRVSYDNAVSNLAEPIHTEPFSLTRHTFDADVRYLPMAGTSLGLGMTRTSEDRTYRIFENNVDNVVRVTFDTIGNRWFSVRSRYEHAERRGKGFDVHLLEHVGEQPGMRHFDVASRDRDRVTVTGMVFARPDLVLNLSVAAGNDDYLESLFGLRDNKHRVWGAGFDATPRENVSFGVSYNREQYLALSRSRQANPGVQFGDESRNWAADSDDSTHSTIAYANFLGLIDKLDVRVGWDMSRTKATYLYVTGPVVGRTLPEETPDLPTTLADPTQLPDVISNLNRATVDFEYSLTARLALGVSYWYEKFEVQDFALDAESSGNLVNTTATGAANAILIGYLYRPYTAQTGWVRLIVRW